MPDHRPSSAGNGGGNQKSSIVKVPKAAELVAADLRRRIVSGELKPGELLPNETLLMEQFGVSRPTLREAFRILETEAILTVMRGAKGGGQVLEPKGSTAAHYMGLLLQYQGAPLSDVYRARAELEVSVIGLLGATRRKASLRELDAIVQRAAEIDPEDRLAAAEFNQHFHVALIEAPGSSTIEVLGRMLLHIIEAHNAVFVASRPRGDESRGHFGAVRAFKKLVKLLTEGDTVAAQRHWRRHLESVEKFMVGDSDAPLVEMLL